jgi:hypothetical protein
VANSDLFPGSVVRLWVPPGASRKMDIVKLHENTEDVYGFVEARDYDAKKLLNFESRHVERWKKQILLIPAGNRFRRLTNGWCDARPNRAAE